jgi:hypothetical protein
MCNGAGTGGEVPRGERWEADALCNGTLPRRWKLSACDDVSLPNGSVVYVRFSSVCPRPYIVVHEQARIRKRSWDETPATVLVTGDESVMGRCASVLTGPRYPFLTLADARIDASRLCRVAEAYVLAILLNTHIPAKEMVWWAVNAEIST